MCFAPYIWMIFSSFSWSTAAHEQHPLLGTVVTVQTAGLHAKITKCMHLTFQKLEYLGYVVSSHDSLKSNPAKCKAIQEWSQPTNLGEL